MDPGRDWTRTLEASRECLRTDRPILSTLSGWPDGCSVFGYYEHRTHEPSVIHVHPSATFARDSFTILHELGHHVQRQHADWMDVRFEVSRTLGTLWEERVADAFAAELLMPKDIFGSDTSILSARSLSDMHSRTLASRAAVAMRALELAPRTLK